MAQRPRYTDDDVAVALAFLQSAGYPETKGAMALAARHTKIPRNTLRRWVNGEMHQVGNDIVTRKTVDLAEAIDSELAEIFHSMSAARDEASYKDLATAAGILIDKKQLLSGKPTQRIATIQEELAETPEDERDAVLAEAREILRLGAIGDTGSQAPD